MLAEHRNASEEAEQQTDSKAAPSGTSTGRVPFARGSGAKVSDKSC
jgi:hypothetical protein